MEEALRRYVPSAVTTQLARGGVEAAEREISVLFVDIRGYTSFAETRRATEVFATVSRYAEAVSAIARERGGAVAEFSGDGMMVVFGAPQPLRRRNARPSKPAVKSSPEWLRYDPTGTRAGRLAVGVGHRHRPGVRRRRALGRTAHLDGDRRHGQPGGPAPAADALDGDGDGDRRPDVARRGSGGRRLRLPSTDADSRPRGAGGRLAVARGPGGPPRAPRREDPSRIVTGTSAVLERRVHGVRRPVGHLAAAANAPTRPSGVTGPAWRAWGGSAASRAETDVVDDDAQAGGVGERAVRGEERGATSLRGGDVQGVVRVTCPRSAQASGMSARWGMRSMPHAPRSSTAWVARRSRGRRNTARTSASSSSGADTSASSSNVPARRSSATGTRRQPTRRRRRSPAELPVTRSPLLFERSRGGTPQIDRRSPGEARAKFLARDLPRDGLEDDVANGPVAPLRQMNARKGRRPGADARDRAALSQASERRRAWMRNLVTGEIRGPAHIMAPARERVTLSSPAS